MMLITGIAAAMLINLNPLIKLDGYYMMCEAIGLNELKEDSTAYVSGWVKRNIWDLPVEVPYVPRRRRLGYVVYALLSGVYSYTILYILARFVGNVSQFRSRLVVYSRTCYSGFHFPEPHSQPGDFYETRLPGQT